MIIISDLAQYSYLWIPDRYNLNTDIGRYLNWSSCAIFWQKLYNIKAFYLLYNENKNDFPLGCRAYCSQFTKAPFPRPLVALRSTLEPSYDASLVVKVFPRALVTWLLKTFPHQWTVHRYRLLSCLTSQDIIIKQCISVLC